MTKHTYLLKLGDGSDWLFQSTPGTRLWVSKLAAIMNLRPEGQYQRNSCSLRICFVRRPIPLSLRIEALRIKYDFRSLRFWSHRAGDLICEIGNEDNHELDIIRMWTALYIIYLRVQASGGLAFHAGLVERQGKGILLAGPGGAGKSTLCRRLNYPWSVLSDDQSLIVCAQQKTYPAHPLPTWSDCLKRQTKKRWDVGYSIPLTAIFFIEQAPTDEAVHIGQGQAAALINRLSQDLYRPIFRNLDVSKRQVAKIFDNSCKLAGAVPCYILRASANGRFWDEIEKTFLKELSFA